MDTKNDFTDIQELAGLSTQDVLKVLGKVIVRLKQKVELLENKRIYQTDLSNDSVKQRHIAEGVKFLRGGASTAKPTAGEEPLQGNAVYFSETDNKLYIWNRTTNVWISVTLS